MTTDAPMHDPLLDTLRLEAANRQLTEQSAATPLTPWLPEPGKANYLLGEFLGITEPRQFLEAAYSCLLRREIDPDSLEAGLSNLEHGTSRLTLLNQIAESPEAKPYNITVTGLSRLQRIEHLQCKYPRIMRRLKRLTDALLRHEERKALQAVQPAINQHLAAQITQLQPLLQHHQQQHFQLTQLEQHIAALRSQLHYQQREREHTDSASGITTAPTNQPSGPTELGHQQAFQAFYLAFENHFRGTPAQIHNKLSQYLAYLPPPTHDHYVLDMGCGRGEWLSLVKHAGYPVIGLDTNRVMLALCHEQGLEAHDTPLHTWLKSAPDNSLCALTGFHIAEHLPFQYLLQLLQDGVRALRPGGVLILETPNPENTTVGSHAFYHDPTHQNPLTPSLMQFVAEYLGLTRIQILRLNPLPDTEHLSGNTQESHFLNAKFCSAQDYALIAYKPEQSTQPEANA